MRRLSVARLPSISVARSRMSRAERREKIARSCMRVGPGFSPCTVVESVKYVEFLETAREMMVDKVEQVLE